MLFLLAFDWGVYYNTSCTCFGFFENPGRIIMKKRLKSLLSVKRLGVILAMQMLIMAVLTGCGKESAAANPKVEEAKDKVVMTIEDFDATQQLYNLYVIQYLYTNKTEPLSLDESGVTEIQDSIIQEMKSEIVQYLLATMTDGVEVTDSALATSEASAASMYDYFGEKFLAEYGVDYDCIKELFNRQAYISALKDKAIADMRETYTEQYTEKYGDLNFHSLYYALFPSIQYDGDGNPVKDDDGNYVSLTDAEMKDQLAKATELMNRAKAGEKLEDLVEEYGITASSGEEKNYEGAYSEELNTVVASLSENDISDVVTTDAGYMVVRMDKKNDQEYKDYAIQSAANQTADNSFPSMQSNWLTAAGADKVEANQDIINELDIVELGKVMQKKGFY